MPQRKTAQPLFLSVTFCLIFSMVPVSTEQEKLILYQHSYVQMFPSLLKNKELTVNGEYLWGVGDTMIFLCASA